MSLFRLAFLSLLSRRMATGLTVFSIALSVALLLSVETAKRAAEESFTGAISQVDLIVGGRTGSVQLMMYTVFNVGSASHNVSWEAYQRWAKHPAVAWTIPYSLGDSHRGFRVVGTTGDFFEHYRFRGDQKIQFALGTVFAGAKDVVIGAAVAKDLGYELGQKVVVSHGATKGTSFHEHAESPLSVVGILKFTGTPIDRSVFVSLEAMERMHHEEGHHHDEADHEGAQEISAFFLRTKSRVDSLRLQREINEDRQEPLLAIIPGVTLQELWRSLGHLEVGLTLISWMVMAVSLATMLIALFSTLQLRRREMAILRSVGAKPTHLLALLTFEALFLTFAGVVIGSVVLWGLIHWGGPWFESEYGLSMDQIAISSHEVARLGLVCLGGLLVGFIPAFQARRQALKDGLNTSL